MVTLMFERVSFSVRPYATTWTILAFGAAIALMVHARAKRAEKAHPPQGRFVEVDGVRVHYIERGQGQPLVVLHGNGSMAEEFISSKFVELATQSFRVIAFDRPGYGYTDRPRSRVWTPIAQADLLTQALTRIGIDRCVILGHSWGASVAVAIALRHPEAVRGLILESGYYFPTPRADAVLFSTLALPVIGDALRYTVSPLASRLLWPVMLRKLFSPAPVASSFKSFPSSLALRPSQLRASAAESVLMIPDAAALQKHYQELRMPVAVVAGTGDEMVDIDTQSRRLHSAIRQSSLHVVDGCGHMVHHTAPRRVLAALEEVARAT